MCAAVCFSCSLVDGFERRERMHAECFRYVSQFSTNEAITIVEIGSRDINGSVRPLFPAATYIGLDLHPGPSVDVVCDAMTWTPETPAELVLCLEVLEHTPHWMALLSRAYEWLRPDGRIVVTCAGHGREQHSAIDGGRLRPGEYYRNLSDTEIAEGLMAAGFGWIESRQVGNDTQAFAIRDGHEPRQKRQEEIRAQYESETQRA